MFNLEVRFKQSGLKSVEVIDNGSGISESDYEKIGPFRLFTSICSI